jgi:hypothetical protein
MVWPNYSFKPNPLRGIACVPALRLHAFAATARVGLTRVLGIAQGLLVKVKDLFWIVVFGAAGIYATSPRF